jgi:hypothetical protein
MISVNARVCVSAELPDVNVNTSIVVELKIR